MAATEIPRAIEEQSASRILADGSLANSHAQAFNKILDLNYEMDRKTVSLQQALGVREVTSKSGQIGIPMAAAAS
jgi:hypothetical protein